MAESLVDAVLRQREEQRRREVSHHGTEVVASYLRCLSCDQPIRDDNETRLCRGCQRRHRSTLRCRCGCGRPLDLRNVTGYARGCSRGMVRMLRTR
jgi:hypothetical protein